MDNDDVPWPGGLNGFSLQAKCGENLPKVCKDLRRPYTNLNVLKMRYHRTDGKNDTSGDNNSDTNVLAKGTGEGMTAIDRTEAEACSRDLIGKQVGGASLLGLTSCLTQLYRDRDYFLSRAIIPVQEVRGGSLRGDGRRRIPRQLRAGETD